MLAIQEFVANGGGRLDRHVGAAGVLHRGGGRAAVAVRVGAAPGVPLEKSRGRDRARARLLRLAGCGSGLCLVRIATQRFRDWDGCAYRRAASGCGGDP